MAVSKWRVLSNGLQGCSQFLPSPTKEALLLVSNVVLITAEILEKNEANRRHQELVERLSTRAEDVSQIIQRHESELREDPHCRNFFSNFLGTMADVEVFCSKINKKCSTWKSLKTAFDSSIDAEFDNLLRRLDTVIHDFQSHLLSNKSARGPHQLIRHPQMQFFWKWRLADAIEVKWMLFWDHFLDEFPFLEQFFSGDHRKSSFQAKAKTRDANNVSPWEINNFFQPPEARLEQIVRRTLDLGSSILPPILNYQTEDSSVSSKGEIQSWKGYWEQSGVRGNMDAELYFAGSSKIFGAGSDMIGDFTWTGHISKGQRVLLRKQYIGKHAVLYDGVKSSNDKIEGVWSIANFDSGPFCLERTTAAGTDQVEVPVGTSRKWRGYYVQKGFRSEMTAEFVFTSNCKIYGKGSDAIGSFTWQGTFQMDRNGTMEVQLVKQYAEQHAVVYNGRISDDLIMKGDWVLANGEDAGTFELRTK